MLLNRCSRFERKTQQESTSSRKRFDVIVLTQAIALVIPILYVIGRVYYESYLGVYGLNNELFPREINDYLYFALLSIIQVTYSAISSSDWSRAINWALVIPIYVGLLLWLNSLRIGARVHKKIRSIMVHKAVRILSVLSSGLLAVGIVLYMGLLLIVLIIFPVAVGLNAGKQVAQDEITKDSGICEKIPHEISKSCTAVLIKGEQQMIGRVVTATESHIAVAKDGEVRVFERNNITLSSSVR